MIGKIAGRSGKALIIFNNSGYSNGIGSDTLTVLVLARKLPPTVI